MRQSVNPSVTQSIQSPFVHVSFPRRLLRLLLSVAVVAAIVVVCVFAPHVDVTTVMLVLLLAVLIIASRWGLWESVTAAAMCALLLDYFFLPPHGWGIQAPQHLVALVTFLGIALVAGKLAERATAQAIRETERRIESERLYTFARDFVGSGSFEVIVARALDSLVRSFELRAAAFYSPGNREVIRSGSDPGAIAEDKLRDAAFQLKIQKQLDVLLTSILIDGQPIGSLAICGDNISELTLRAIAERMEIGIVRARALEQLNQTEAVRKSQELASAVLDSLVHEIKTPLSVVKTAATALLSGNMRTSPRVELLALISEEIDQVDTTINEIFWRAQMKSGTLQPEIEPHDIQHLVKTSLGELRTRISARPLKVEISDSLPPADFDFHMIKVVFKELMSNALKYSQDKSPLTISAQLSGTEIVTGVRDSGIGISQQEAARVFERSYRGTDAVPGTGLGLAIAKIIVEAHGGHLGAISAPGEGSLFYFSLPASLGRLA
jgi:two-component system, OmpR family, sensor histidine kinase KdpD